MENDLKEIFDRIKVLLDAYNPPLTAEFDFDSRYELWSHKEITVQNRKKDKVFFSGIIIQRHYTGFYFMPVYTDPDIKEKLGEKLLKNMKGKSCFHIKKYDDDVFNEIKEALESGYKLYQEKGWIESF